MHELSAPFEARSSSPSLVVQVSKFPIDWGASHEFEDVTGERFSLLGQLILSGAWLLNPMFTVYSHTPSAAFFQAALRARGQWLRTFRSNLDNRGLRDQARNSEQRGRRVGYLESLSAQPAKGTVPGPGESLRLSDLSREQRSAVLAGGKLARQFAFSGIMIIDGNHVPPRTWQAQADQVLHPNKPRITVVRRRIDLATLRFTADVEPLKRLAREALQAHLDHHPNDAVFVTPQATVSAPSASPEFYFKADQQKAAWCTLLKRNLRGGLVRRLRRVADQETLCLVFSGTLIVAGQVYLPGFWPNRTPKPKQLDGTPFHSPTVPLSFLGLKPRDDSDGTKRSNPAWGTDRRHRLSGNSVS